jgi:hypothetical protein
MYNKGRCVTPRPGKFLVTTPREFAVITMLGRNYGPAAAAKFAMAILTRIHTELSFVRTRLLVKATNCDSAVALASTAHYVTFVLSLHDGILAHSLAGS